MTAIEPDILDLFADTGGWDRGAEIAGIDPERIAGVEFDAAAVQTARAAGYNRLHGNVLDLHTADFPNIRGLISSAPCPTFAACGKRIGLAYPYVTRRDAFLQLSDKQPYLLSFDMKEKLAECAAWYMAGPQ